MRYTLALLLALVTPLVHGQTQFNPHSQIRWPGVTGSGTPTSLSLACTTTNYGEPYTNTSVTPNVYYVCSTAGWLIVSSNGVAISPTSVTATGTLPVSVPTGLFGYGSLGYNDSNTVAAYAASVNNYFQAVIQNTSNGTSASADYVVSNNLGTATTYYGDFGMNSSTFSGTGSGALPNAVYMTANNGDLVFGTNTSNYLRFYVNGSATDSIRITPAGVIQFPGIAAGSSTNCIQIDTSGNISNTGSACGATLTANALQWATSTSSTRAATYSDVVGLWASGTCTSGFLEWNGSCATPTGTVGATGNQLSADKAVPGLLGTGATGNFGGGVDYTRFGDSTVAYDQGDMGNWYTISQIQGQPLYGTFLIKKITSPYTCSSNNYVFTVDNSLGWAVPGDYVQTNGPIVVTGSLTQEEFNERYATIVSSTPTTVTVAYASGSATVNCTTVGSWAGTGVISPNVTRNGNPGATLSVLSGTALTNSLAVMSAKAAAGYTPVFTLRAGINDWRLNRTNLPTYVALVKSVLSTVQSYSGLAGIPMIYIVPNAVNAAGVPHGNTGSNAMCQAGQPGTGNCAAGTIAAPTLPGAISAGANTVTLVNPTGQTYCPFWIGSGAPFELTSNGNPFQLDINYGGGDYETVTVTAFSANITDNTHYTCNVSFTSTNAHSAGEPVMFTNLWMAQWMTDAMNYAGGAVLKMAATTFPTLKVINTQDLIYGHYASPTIPPSMTDALHPQGYLEDNYIGALLSSVSANPTFWTPDRPAQSLTTGGTYNEYTASSLTNFDPYFSEQAANLSRSGCGYWNTGSTAPYCYQLWAEDPNYFKVQWVGSLSAPYTAGTTGTITLSSLTSNTLDVRGNAYAALSDILCAAGIGCWPGLIASTPGGAGGYQISLTIGGSGIPVNLPTATLFYVMRYRSYDYSGIPYLRNPGTYYHAPQGYISAGGSNTYTVTLFGGNNGSLAEFMSNGVVTIYTYGSSPITAASMAVAGSGYDGGGTGTDTVSIPCGATFTINVTSGTPTGVAAITAGGTNCSSGTSLTTTGGTGTGFKITVTAGTFTAPSGTICSQSGVSTVTTLACTDSSGTNYSYLVGLPVDMWSQTPPDGQFSNVAATCLKLKETGTTTPGFAATLCGAASYGNQRTLTLQDASGTLPITIASGTSALGTSAIGAGACASVVTTTATSAATTDTISWAFNAAPGTGYTAGLHVLAYLTSGNVNWLVCNPTAGSLTPAAATLNWRVIR